MIIIILKLEVNCDKQTHSKYTLVLGYTFQCAATPLTFFLYIVSF